MLPIERLLGRHGETLVRRDFGVLLTANAVAATVTALVSPLLATLTRTYGVSPAEIGLVVTAAAAPGIALIPVGGTLADRYGRKPVLITGLLVFGAAGGALAFVRDFPTVLALRAVQGVGFAWVIPVVITSLRDLFDGDGEATAQGLRFAVSGVSQTVFSALAGVLVVLGWRYPFLVFAGAIPVAGLLFWQLDEPRSSPATPETAGRPDYVPALRSALSDRRTVAALLARGLAAVPFVGFLTYNSVIVADVLDGTPGQAGLVVAAFSLVNAAVATQAGRVTDLFDSRTYPLVLANLCIGVGVAGFSFATSVPLVFSGTLFLGVGVGITFSLYRSLVTGLAPAQFRGGVVSLGEALGRLSFTLTPVVMGVAIGGLAPATGPESAVRWTVFVPGVLSAAGGVVCSVVACR